MKRVFTLLGVVFLLAVSSAWANNGGQYYEVSVTNLTQGQIMSPPVVLTHNDTVSLFNLGHPASDGLAALAEDADSTGLVEMMSANPGVVDVQVGGGVIHPGGTMTIVVRAEGSRSLISLASMLVTTNDSFAGLHSLQTSPGGTVSMVIPAYDAGSEENNEMCAFIPGPPCGSGGVRSPENAEGYVHIGNGVQGIADLDGSHDWRNPVAVVRVRRLDN